jgi:hypothetical protein
MSARGFAGLALIVTILSGMACRTLIPATATETATVAPSPKPSPTIAPTTGTLNVEIVYSGQWYCETFGYEPDAPNIRHIALVLPVDARIGLRSPGLVFTNLKFTPSPEPLAIREETPEYDIFLDYLYDAPQGVTSIELDPGEYNLAVAFIAAALPPPDDDAILYPGITGGGASTEFQTVEIAAGETVNLTVELTDANGWGFLLERASR